MTYGAAIPCAPDGSEDDDTSAAAKQVAWMLRR